MAVDVIVDYGVPYSGCVCSAVRIYAVSPVSIIFICILYGLVADLSSNSSFVKVAQECLYSIHGNVPGFCSGLKRIFIASGIGNSEAEHVLHEDTHGNVALVYEFAFGLDQDLVLGIDYRGNGTGVLVRVNRRNDDLELVVLFRLRLFHESKLNGGISAVNDVEHLLEQAEYLSHKISGSSRSVCVLDLDQRTRYFCDISADLVSVDPYYNVLIQDSLAGAQIQFGSFFKFSYDLVDRFISIGKDHRVPYIGIESGKISNVVDGKIAVISRVELKDLISDFQLRTILDDQLAVVVVLGGRGYVAYNALPYSGSVGRAVRKCIDQVAVTVYVMYRVDYALAACFTGNSSGKALKQSCYSGQIYGLTALAEDEVPFETSLTRNAETGYVLQHYAYLCVAGVYITVVYDYVT